MPTEMRATEPVANTSFVSVQRSRSNSMLRRKRLVRRGWLASVFFPHYHEGTEDEQAEFDATLRGKISKAIHGKIIQTLLLLLLVADVCIVIAEILITGHKECFVEPAKVPGCFGKGVLVRGEEYSIEGPDCPLVIRNELPSHLEHAEVGLRWASRAILFVFAAELLVLMVCLLGRFFTRLYVLDTVIIVTSIVLDFTIHGDAGIAQELLIFVRVWRFARILHGVGLTVHDVDEEEKEKAGQAAEKKIEALEAELRDVRGQLAVANGVATAKPAAIEAA